MTRAIPVAIAMSPEWMNFLVMAGAFLLVALGGLLWLFLFRKNPRRRRKRRHHHGSRSASAPLAQQNVLPPGRLDEKSSRLPPTTS